MSKRRQALADTSVVINPAHVGNYADELAVSVVTIAELQFGLTADGDLIEQQRRRLRLQDTVNRFDVLPFDLAATEFYGTLCGYVRQQGRSPRGRRMDLMIAATAVRYDLPLLTRNADDFTGLGSVVSIIGF